MRRVVHLGYSDLLPGASRASYRLHKALLDLGLDSLMVVSLGLSGDREVDAPRRLRRAACRIASRADSAATRLLFRGSAERSVALCGSGLVNRVAKLTPDVVQLHWIAGGLVRPRGLRRLPNVPVVWRLPDEWPTQGSAHYADDDFGTVDRVLLARKLRAVRSIPNLTVVAPSSWLASVATSSPVFADRPVEVIQTGVDLEVWAPRDRRTARLEVGLEPDRPVVLFSASGGPANPRKGWDLLDAAVSQLDRDVTLLAVGGPTKERLGRIVRVGRVQDESELRTLYAAADVVVVPSRRENLPNTGIEALACGTPVVGFSVGGMPDLVEHGVSGWLARPFDEAGLVEGIEWALTQDRSRAARARAEGRFDLTAQAKRYLQLYEALAG